jgi:Fic family protein
MKDLGLDVRRQARAEGVVQILLDATLNYKQELTSETLFGWHAALFPTGYSGLLKIRVASWRDDSNGPMRVVSGLIGREKNHYEALPSGRLVNEMSRVLDWWEESRKEMDGLLRASMTHVSRATAQRELADLVHKNILRSNPGGGRSASYDLCWDAF